MLVIPHFYITVHIDFRARYVGHRHFDAEAHTQIENYTYKNAVILSN
jgi:hypothetical protein